MIDRESRPDIFEPNFGNIEPIDFIRSRRQSRQLRFDIPEDVAEFFSCTFGGDKDPNVLKEISNQSRLLRAWIVETGGGCRQYHGFVDGSYAPPPKGSIDWSWKGGLGETQYLSIDPHIIEDYTWLERSRNKTGNSQLVTVASLILSGEMSGYFHITYSHAKGLPFYQSRDSVGALEVFRVPNCDHGDKHGGLAVIKEMPDQLVEISYDDYGKLRFVGLYPSTSLNLEGVRCDVEINWEFDYFYPREERAAEDETIIHFNPRVIAQDGAQEVEGRRFELSQEGDNWVLTVFDFFDSEDWAYRFIIPSKMEVENVIDEKGEQVHRFSFEKDVIPEALRRDITTDGFDNHWMRPDLLKTIGIGLEVNPVTASSRE